MTVAAVRVYRCANPAKWHPTLHRTAHHHNPPSSWTADKGASSDVVELCGICHYEVHALLNLFVRHGGPPPWPLLRTFMPFIRRMAERAWSRRIPGRTPFTTVEGATDEP